MTETYDSSYQAKLLIAVCLATVITPLMSTMMNLSLMSIGEDFGVGSHAQAYVNTVFLLGSVVSMVPAAKFASIRGMKKVFVLGLCICMGASILSILSPTFWFLLLMRFTIGFGSAMLAVTSVAMLTYVFPITQRGKVLGINTTFVYLALSIGPTVGGVITDTLGWRAIFGLIFILSLGATVYVLRLQGEITPLPGEEMDWTGSVLWGTMIVILMMGFVNITQPWGPYMVVIGTVLLIAVWLHLRRSEKPVLSVGMFHHRLFTRSCAAAFLNYGSSYCVAFFLSLYLQSVGKMTATEAGIVMLVQPLFQVLLTMKMGELSDRMQNKILLPMLGSLVTGLGMASFIMLGVDFDLYYTIGVMAICGIGLAMFSAPNNSLIMSSVPGPLKGEASGMLAVVRQSGMMISMSLAMTSIAVVMGSMDNLGPDTLGSFVSAMHMTFTVCLLMNILCFILCAIRISPDTELT
ncbi:MAG: MFS transporter [Candidatus Methanomethylophilus sp.]|nr:MFS transporter [Methanomethylophilus sp.]